MSMSFDLQQAIRDWNREVEHEATELIESGVAPYDALERARSIVSARRREKKFRERMGERTPER